jgi:hypothetical protein
MKSSGRTYKTHFTYMEELLEKTETENHEKKLSFGEKLVGLNFNPSKNLRVQRAKEICAELANIVDDDSVRGKDWDLHKTLSEHTLGEILNAQMNVVKLITLEY